MEKIDKEGIKNPTLEDLKDVSVDLTSVSLEGLAEGSYKFDEKFNNLPDNSWGTQNGVILYKTEGRVFATPYNSKTIEKIRETELPENINSIPNINDLNVWGGDESRRNQMSSLKEWVDLMSKSDEFERAEKDNLN